MSDHNKEINIYTQFSSIPLEIEGSNLEKIGWMPSESDKINMGEENYFAAIEEAKLLNEKVIFKNVSLKWDSCDCSNGYGCSHGGFVYEIEIKNGDKTYTVDFEGGDSLVFEGDEKMVQIPTDGATIYDFYRACELCGIQLEFSDYALSLLNPNRV